MRLSEIAQELGCTLFGDGEIEITRVATIEDAGPGDITFLANPKYIPKLSQCRASAIISGDEVDPANCPSVVLRSSNPYVRPLPGVLLHSAAAPAGHPRYRHHRFVSRGSRYGERRRLLPGGSESADRRARCPLLRLRRVIKDDVEIGAGTTIDRAALGETLVKRGVEIDDQVMIGHACVVGENTILCAQVGLSGTTKVGKNVILAGQVGAGGHLTIGDGAAAIAQAGIPGDVAPGAIVAGSPGISREEWLQSSAVHRRLPELQKSVRKLQKEVAELTGLLRSLQNA